MSTARVTSAIVEVISAVQVGTAAVAVPALAGTGKGTRTGTGSLAVRPAYVGNGPNTGRGAISITTLLLGNRTAVTYAVVVDGRVVSVTTGLLPVSTATVLYFDLTGYATPSVGDYFSEICQTFSASEPTVPPGEVVPPWKPRDGTDGKDGTNGKNGGTGPFPPAHTLPGLIVFHGDGATATTIASCPSALTEVNVKLRTAFDLADVCAIRLQCDVRTPCAGAELVLQYSLDAGATWDFVGDGGVYGVEGPYVGIDAAGDQRGDFDNVVAGAQGDVLLSVFSRNGDGATTVSLGNIGALMYAKTTQGSACTPIGDTCDILPAYTVGPAGYVYRDDFTSYANTAALIVSYPGSTCELYECTDSVGTTTGGGVVGNAAVVTTLSKLRTYGTPIASYWYREVEYIRSDYPAAAAEARILADLLFTDPLGASVGYLVAGGSGGGAWGAVAYRMSNSGGVSHSSTRWYAGGGSVGSGSVIDLATYAAAGQHNLVVNVQVTTGAPGSIRVRAWDNDVLMLEITFAATANGLLSTHLMQVQFPGWSALRKRRIVQFIEGYNGDVTPDPYGYGE